MSLPRFLDRILDAAVPVLGGLQRGVVQERLKNVAVTLHADGRAEEGSSRAGFLLAANLAARLYPRIGLSGPPDMVRDAAADIVLINPRADVDDASAPTDATLSYEHEVTGGPGVAVFARGWNVSVDGVSDLHQPAAPPAALLAATIGVAELFRVVFASELGPRGRLGPSPGVFNLVTLGEPSFDLPTWEPIDVGRLNLVGAGAIGQSAALALAESGIRGTMLTVDPERIELSNLQRYVLTRDSDIGAGKVELLRDRLTGSELDVVPIPMEWRAMLVDTLAPTLVAVDSPEARIGIQSSLPGPIYNSWTQPADVGWSRHELFGEEPCLACLYWPDRQVPSRHEQVAAAFRQHPLRVLAYLVHRNIPVGLPLPPGGIPDIPGMQAPAEADQWMQRPLIDDIAAAAGMSADDLAPWRDRPLADVYEEGICGGALLHLEVGIAPQEVLVPLAHQSVFAGIMLATQLLVASLPDLARVRPVMAEGRFDVLSGLPQVLGRPRVRTDGCLCGDPVFLEVYRRKLSKTDDDTGAGEKQ